MKIKSILILPLLILITLGFTSKLLINCKTENKKNHLDVTSKSFSELGMIPAKYTCDAENISPQIAWTKGPDSTKTYVLICDDPDAPSKVWVHWVLFNIPPTTLELTENFSLEKKLLPGALDGINDFGTPGYSGPCPPNSIHRYLFKIYALNIELNLKADATKADVEKAMQNHILAEGTLTGKYKRK